MRLKTVVLCTRVSMPGQAKGLTQVGSSLLVDSIPSAKIQTPTTRRDT
jgi:hypothetical protein